MATTEISISYVRPSTMKTGNMIGRANTVYAGRDTGISAVHVEDRHGRLLAHGTTRCVIQDLPFDPDGELLPIPPTIEDPPDPYLRPVDVPKPDLAEMTRLAPLEAMKEYVDGSRPFGPFKTLSGFRPVSVSDGEYVVDVPASPWYSGGLPTMYGGAMDSVMTGAIYSSLEPGAVNANLDLKVRFLRPAYLDGGVLHIESEVVHRGRTVRTARSEMTDANGKRVALATSSAMIVPDAAMELMTGRKTDEIVTA